MTCNLHLLLDVTGDLIERTIDHLPSEALAQDIITWLKTECLVRFPHASSARAVKNTKYRDLLERKSWRGAGTCCFFFCLSLPLSLFFFILILHIMACPLFNRVFEGHAPRRGLRRRCLQNPQRRQ